MFSNESGSPAFDNFYKELGNMHKQKGFKGYRAGLDVNNSSTGEYMVHATEFGKEIVFHVSTLLYGNFKLFWAPFPRVSQPYTTPTRAV